VKRDGAAMRWLALPLVAAACGHRDEPQRAATLAPATHAAPDAEIYVIPDNPPPVDAQSTADQLMGSDKRHEHLGANYNPPHGGTDSARNDTGPPSPPAASPGRISVAEKQAFDETSLTDDDVLKTIMTTHMREVLACYKQALKRDPTLRGKVVISFDVLATGRIGAHDAHGFDDALDTCVKNYVASWRFAVPEDKDGAAADAEFQFTLQLVPD
jgi:hypothetical protein